MNIRRKMKNSFHAEPLVSVVIPAYNCAAYLGETLDSVLRQTYKHVEIIVCNDGSTDGTGEVAKTYRDSINYISQQNMGVSAARNSGLKIAGGEFVMFLDSDDLLAPEKLAEQVSYLTAHPEIGAVYCAWEFVDSNGTFIGEGGASLKGNLLNHFMEWNIAPFHSYLFRMPAVREIGYFRQGIDGVEDWDFLIRLASTGTLFDVIEKPMVKYRMHGNNITRNSELMLANHIKMFDRLFEELEFPREILEKREHLYFTLRVHACSELYRKREYRKAGELFNLAVKAYPEGITTQVFFGRLSDCLQPFENGCYTESAENRENADKLKEVYRFFISSIADRNGIEDIFKKSQEMFSLFLDS